jgi:hypothetical protein
VHDLILVGFGGDGRTDVLTVSDQNDVMWDDIPEVKSDEDTP